MIAVIEDGGHGVLIEYLSVLVPNQVQAFAIIGISIGFNSGVLSFLGEFLGGLSEGKSFEEAVKDAKGEVVLEIFKIAALLHLEGFTATAAEIAFCTVDLKGIHLDMLWECAVEFVVNTAIEKGLSKFYLERAIEALHLGAIIGMGTALAWIAYNIRVSP